jgi:hypothetical protein
MEYTQQHPTDSRDWRQNGENSRLNLEHLKQIDRSAQNAGVSPLYRCFSVPVADGKAHYQVVRVKKKTAIVRICDGICLDGYCDMVLGEESEISIDKVMELVGRNAALNRLFGG